MYRFGCVALIILSLGGCGGSDFRHGYSPGDAETSDNAMVFHLADGVLVEERRDGVVHYYLIESTVADYQLTSQGLDVVFEGDISGTFSTEPAPEGYVAAWITQAQDKNPGVTRFKIDDEAIAEFIATISASTTIQDLYNLKE